MEEIRYYLAFDSLNREMVFVKKDFYSRIATIQVIKNKSSFYSLQFDLELVSKVYDMDNSEDVQILTERFINYIEVI